MNKYRINRVLEILLFPFCDTGLRERDCLYLRYLAYEKYLTACEDCAGDWELHEKCAGQYGREEAGLLHYLAGRIGGRLTSYDEIKQLCNLYYPLLDIDRSIRKIRDGGTGCEASDEGHRYTPRHKAGGGFDCGASDRTGGGFDCGDYDRTGGGPGCGDYDRTGGGFDCGASDRTGGGFDCGASDRTGGGLGCGDYDRTGGGFDCGASDRTGGGFDCGASDRADAGPEYEASDRTDVGPEDMGPYYFNILTRIALSLITYRDGTAAIRTWMNGEQDIFYSRNVFDKVEIWNLLIRLTAPDVYIAAFAVECGLGPEALYCQRASVSLADKLLVKYLRKGLAENHLHFNAGLDYEIVWICRMNLVRWRDRGSLKREQIPAARCALFRLMASMFLTGNELGRMSWEQWLGQCGWREMAEWLPDTARRSMPEWRFERGAALCGELQRCLGDGYFMEDYLLWKCYPEYEELRTSSEFLFLYHCCRYIREKPSDIFFCDAFLNYLRIKNSFFRSQQQRYVMEGLGYFQEVYHASSHSLRGFAGDSERMTEIFRSQSRIAGLQKLEIRIAPRADLRDMDCFDDENCRRIIREALREQIFKVLYAYRRYLLEELFGVRESGRLLALEKKREGDCGFSFHNLPEEWLKETGDRVPSEKWEFPVPGIVVHFIKSEYADNLSGFYCWRGIRDEAAKYSGHRLFVRQHMVNIAVAIEELRSRIPGLCEYLVGIDVASDENAMEPWIFTPIYGGIRSRGTVKPVLETASPSGQYRRIQNIGFTYHVGEEFRHILSGLRHIDEVIEGFRYKPGDRLGHAIALGLDIDRWVSENEMTAVPAQEYLEDLLWMWGENVVRGMELPLQMERLEEEILKIAGEIYRHQESLTVRMLYRAYRGKFTGTHREILERLECGENGPMRKDSSVFCRYSADRCISETPVWTEDKLLSTNYCPVFEENCRKVLLVSVRREDVPVYRLLQEMLLDKVERIGIYVEVNPTSNVTIGAIDNIEDHPVFRMNGLEEKDRHVMVTVNSDDPSVFNTNVENELAYIYHALVHKGFPKEKVLNWVDKVRENGIKASFIAEKKTGRRILSEINLLLDQLAGV